MIIEEMIVECNKLGREDINKSEYLAKLVCQRLEENYQKYDKEFTEYVEELSESLIKCRDLSVSVNALGRLSKTMTSSIKLLIKSLSKFEEIRTKFE